MTDSRATRTLSLPTIEFVERPRPTHASRLRDLEEARLLLCVLIEQRVTRLWNEEIIRQKRREQDARQREENRVRKAMTIEGLSPLSAGSSNIRNTDFITASQDIIPFDIWDSLSLQEQKNVYNIQDKYRRSRSDLGELFRRKGYLGDDQWAYKALVLDSQKVYYKHSGSWTDPIIINDISWKIEPGVNLVPKPFMDLWEQSQRERQPPFQESVPTKRRQKIEFEWPNLSASMSIDPVRAVNIKTLGARGDGITDATGALQARSDALGKDWERIVALTRDQQEERFNGVRAPEGMAWKNGQIVPAPKVSPVETLDAIDRIVANAPPKKPLAGKRFVFVGRFDWTITSLIDFIEVNGGSAQRIGIKEGADAAILGEQTDLDSGWVKSDLAQVRRFNLPVIREIDFVQAVQEKRDPLIANAPSKKPLAGKRFVITGTLSKTRTDVTDDIRSYGGQVQIAVTKETDYLIQGDSPGAVKMEASRRLNIPVIGENALQEMIDGTYDDLPF